MKLYILQQHTFHEGSHGDLEYSGAKIIGIYTNDKTPNKIVKEFVPITFKTQYGEGEQSLFVTEIESDTQINEFTVISGSYCQQQYDDEDNIVEE